MRPDFMREFTGVPLNPTETERALAATAFSKGLLDCLERDVADVEAGRNIDDEPVLNLHLCTAGLSRVVEFIRVTTTTGEVKMELVSVEDFTDVASGHHYKLVQPNIGGNGTLTRYDQNDLDGYYGGLLSDVKQIIQGRTPYTNQNKEPLLPMLNEDQVDHAEVDRLFTSVHRDRAAGILTPISREDYYRAAGWL